MNLREFGSWALAQVQVANPEPNNKYKGQCVSLIQQYLYHVFGIPFKAHGNAKDWADNVPDGFEKLSPNIELKRGDILVYGANYGGGYGHIGLIDVNWKFYDQNGVKPLCVGYRDKPFNGYICVLRHKEGVDLGVDDIKQLQDYKIVYGDTLNDIAKRYNTNVQYLANLNRISNPNIIRAGAIIKVPVNENMEQIYTVQRGDSLSSIATKFGTTWQVIYDKNKSVIGNNPNLIHAGLELKI